MVAQARLFFSTRGLKPGDRCALIAPNSIRWAAVDLAMMAEGMIVVPLYVRQDPAELVAMLRDSTPARVVCPDAAHGRGTEEAVARGAEDCACWIVFS